MRPQPHQAMLNDKVEKLQATVAQQQKQIVTLTSQLREQAAQLQKVSAQVEMIRPTPRVVENRWDCRQGALLEKSAFPRYKFVWLARKRAN